VHRARGGGPGGARRGAVVHRGAGRGGGPDGGVVGVTDLGGHDRGERGDLERLAQRVLRGVEGVGVVVGLEGVAAAGQRAVRAGVGDASGERNVGLGRAGGAAVAAGVEGEVHRARGGGPGAAHRGAVVHRGAGRGGGPDRGVVGVTVLGGHERGARGDIFPFTTLFRSGVEGVGVVVGLEGVAAAGQRAVRAGVGDASGERNVG